MAVNIGGHSAERGMYSALREQQVGSRYPLLFPQLMLVQGCEWWVLILQTFPCRTWALGDKLYKGAPGWSIYSVPPSSPRGMKSTNFPPPPPQVLGPFPQ